MIFKPLTCLVYLVEAHFVGVVLVEAVRVSERLQRRHRGQDVAEVHRFPQQPETDQRTCPPQNLHCSLLAATMQTHAIHLKGEDE